MLLVLMVFQFIFLSWTVLVVLLGAVASSIDLYASHLVQLLGHIVDCP